MKGGLGGIVTAASLKIPPTPPLKKGGTEGDFTHSSPNDQGHRQSFLSDEFTNPAQL